MGSRGPIRKHPTARQGHRADNVVELGAPRATAPPAPPPGLLVATRRSWDAYWSSDVAQVVTVADHPAIRRLFLLYDEHARCLGAVRRSGARTVEGSTGQPVISPLAELALKLETAIGRLEGAIGITPMARARLGIAVGHAKLTAHELNRMTDAAGDIDAIDAEGDELLEQFDTSPNDERSS